MSISALDKNTAKLITTTQIITSVSSAAKELIENALDANAKSIEINLIDNGATLIEVKDDGCGISKVDAPNMALSSYTSKICSFSDLDTLKTYGFRGEALNALSVVSDLKIITKTNQDETAVSYTIDHHGCIVNSEPCHRATGTTVQVRQLFKQIPVRRQIITTPKKANQDIKILESIIKSYGICKFLVRLSYKVNSTVLFMKPSIATFEEAVTYVLGRKMTSNMSWINVENAEINMKLMVPQKETQNLLEVFHSGARYIFVNNRPIKHKDLEKMLTNTILEAIGQDSSSKKKPIFLLYILINAANVDINLEPNKTCILFKEQQIVYDTVDKCIKDFYGIQREVQEINDCNESLDYQDYSQTTSINNEKNEQPVCKKRKLYIEECANECSEKNVPAPKRSDDYVVNDLNFVSNNNSECNEQAQITKNGQSDEKESGEKCKKNSESFSIQLPPVDLSDSDSNDSQKFILVCNDNDISNNSINENTKKSTDDSPPFELTPHSDIFNELPIVDLGEDFEWENDSATCNTDTSGKDNTIQSANEQVSHSKINKSVAKKCLTLKEWSKGHVSGLKGGTDVEPYVDKEFNELLKSDSFNGNLCEGFIKYSKHIRSQIVQQNPNMTIPQVAVTIIDFWKKLSPEERGYYRDLAHDEKVEYDINKQEIKEKLAKNVKKCSSRTKKILEKMNTLNFQKKKNSLMRTIVPWDMDVKKITESFLNNSTCNNANFVVGQLCSNLWIIHKSAHIWILDAMHLKKELNISDTNTSEEGAENIEQLLKQWFAEKDDLSLLHPIHVLTQNN